jgi:hypothetical protein
VGTTRKTERVMPHSTRKAGTEAISRAYSLFVAIKLKSGIDLEDIASPALLREINL